jgi:hypothetical protein
MKRRVRYKGSYCSRRIVRFIKDNKGCDLDCERQLTRYSTEPCTERTLSKELRTNI